MFYTHHSHLFSREWFVVHPELVAALKRYGLPLALAALLASTVFLIGTADSRPNMPLNGAEPAANLADELFVPTGISGYLPPQVYELEKQASNK